MMQLPGEEIHGDKGHWKKSRAGDTPTRAFRVTPSALSPCVVRLAVPCQEVCLILFGSVSPIASGPPVSNLHS